MSALFSDGMVGWILCKADQWAGIWLSSCNIWFVQGVFGVCRLGISGVCKKLVGNFGLLKINNKIVIISLNMNRKLVYVMLVHKLASVDLID